MQNISSAEIYYLRQSSVFPFGIHYLKYDNSMIYFYHEGTGYKGSDDLYSDWWSGQNKNNHVISIFFILKRFWKVKKNY